MNNGIFVQDVYGKVGFENSLPKPLLGSTNVIPVPYHLVPSTEWNINYNNLVMVVDTSLITSPVISFLAGGGSATAWSIEWGDGYIDSFSSYNNTVVSHTYSSRGIFIIQVRGNMLAPKITTNALIRILSFGTFSTSANYLSQGGFINNINLIDIPNNIPSTATSLQSLFLICNKLNDTDLSLWNTSNITNMAGTFEQCNANQDLGLWDTSKVTTFASIFKNIGQFNNAGLDSINNWNTSSATSMNQMFFNCLSFNQPLNNWNTVNVTDMGLMFQLASNFNQPLNNWNVRKVGTFASMFRDATRFNSSLSGWSPGANNLTGTTCSDMFRGATSFNQYIGNWNTSKVYNMNHMFNGAVSFNQNIDLWDTQSVGQMESMFVNALLFNSILNLNTVNVTNMGNMFNGARAFNQPINSWNTANVTNMGNMFLNATSFNQPLNDWNVRKVTSFSNMFDGAIALNSSLSGWALGADTAGTSCLGMFQNARYNQPLSSWDTSKVTNMGNMFAQQMTVTGFNQDIGSWNTSSVTTMANMFYNNYFFNNGGSNAINNWNTSNVIDMNSMFYQAGAFNQPIGNWNVSKVRNMSSMFYRTNLFNQDISGWNLAGLNANTSLDNFMLDKTGVNAISTANYDALLIGWNNNKLASANGVANWRTDLRPNFGGAKYTAGGAAAAARAALVSYGWTITDGGVA